MRRKGSAAPLGASSLKRQVLEYLAERGWQEVTWDRLEELMAAFPQAKGRLRRILRESGLPLDPIAEGVRQDTFESLERTLLALGAEYRRRRSEGGQTAAQPCRAAVQEARRHAELAAKNPRLHPARADEKREMLLWIRTWLENPDAFEPWLKLRKRVLASPESPQ